MRRLSGLVLVGLSWALPASAADAVAPQSPTPPSVPQARAPSVPAPTVPSVATPRTRVPGFASAQRDESTPASSLTIGAFRDELRRSPAEVEKESLKKERTHLDESATAVATAREELRKNTARLEDLLRKVVAAKGTPVDESSPEWDPALAPKPGPGKMPLDVLAKAMRGMRPEQAAPIVSRLSRTLGADLMQRMPPADAGAVMGQMKPEVAAEVAAEIASRQPKAGGKK